MRYLSYVRTFFDFLLSRSETATTKRPVILIADGTPKTVREMDGLLQETGYETSTACDVSSVLHASYRRRPSAIILGLHLPGGGPLDAANKLRASQITSSIPIIAVAHPGEQQALLDSGVDRCLDQPARQGAILVALEGLL